MKSLRIFTIALAIMAFSSAAKASINDDGKFTQTYAVSTYVDAMAHGHLDQLSDVLDPDVKFDMIQGRNFVSYGKKDMLNFMQTLKNVQEDCNTTSTIVQTNSSVSVIKVDMQFNGFTRSNYVTIANKGKGWKIINVYSVFN